MLLFEWIPTTNFTMIQKLLSPILLILEVYMIQKLISPILLILEVYLVNYCIWRISKAWYILSVGRLSQHLSNATDIHLKVVFRILIYIKYDSSQGLIFKSDSSQKLTDFTYSYRSSYPADTRRNTTRLCFYLDNSLIHWKSKRQHIVSKSSSKTKYHALANTTCEAQWLLYLLQDLGFPHTNPDTIYYDNKSVIHIANNLVFHEHTKHIEMDCHDVHDKAQNDIIHLLPIQIGQQVIDLFTKARHSGPFHNLSSKLELYNTH